MAVPVRPLGPLLPDPTPAPHPSRITLQGRTVRLEALNESHADGLYPLVGGSENAWLWDYMPDGPFTSIEQFRVSVAAKAQMDDPLFWAVITSQRNTKDNNNNNVGGKGKAVGLVSLLRINPGHRTVEVGAIQFSPVLQRTTAATETIYLLGQYVFRDLGYRRFEWKCNSLNESSRRAALRLGFSYEGLFRQHMIVKGRNRDTAWYAMLSSGWESIQTAFEKWLDPSKFDENGAQLKRLEEFRVV